MKRFLLPFGFLFAAGLFAGTSEQTATAKIDVAPEYGEFSIRIESKCFPNRGDLTKAHNGLVAGLHKKLMDTHFATSGTNDFNGITVHEGISQPYWHTINENGNSHTVCQNTYQKSTTIIFKSNNFDSFHHTYDAVNEDVNAAVKGLEGTARTASVQATVSSPESKICDITRQTVERKALATTREIAQANFAAIFGDTVCLKDVRLIKTSNTQEVSYRRHSYNESALEFGGNDVINFTLTPIEIQITHNYVFEFGDDCHPFAHCK